MGKENCLVIVLSDLAQVAARSRRSRPRRRPQSHGGLRAGWDREVANVANRPDRLLFWLIVG